MTDIGYFYEWVARGAAIGITAFFALAVFALICAALYALLLLGYSAIEGSERDAKGKRRPY